MKNKQMNRSAFTDGDIVRAKVDAQGMKRGEIYMVIETESVDLGLIGTLRTYVLARKDGALLRVDNGGLLLEAAR